MTSSNGLIDQLKKPVNKGENVFISPTSMVIGNVTLGKNCNIWFGSVLRGDTDLISVGEGSNIQDNAVLHADPGAPCIVGEHCIIGHSAIVHGARLDHHVLIGMNATVLNNAQIGAYSIIGANALIPSGMEIPPYSLVLGVPAKVVKTLDESVEQRIQENAEEYIERAKSYMKFYKLSDAERT
jgi:carbonic anhydrase/acetyltransferase-like protein (isoleucine patch superfamily)